MLVPLIRAVHCVPKHYHCPCCGKDGRRVRRLRRCVLSEDERLERHFAQRPGNPYRRHRAG